MHDFPLRRYTAKESGVQGVASHAQPRRGRDAAYPESPTRTNCCLCESFDDERQPGAGLVAHLSNAHAHRLLVSLTARLGADEARARCLGLSLSHRLPTTRRVALTWPAWSRHRWAGVAQEGIALLEAAVPS